MVFLSHPVNMLGLRHWRMSRHSAETQAMMTERLHAWGLTDTARKAQITPKSPTGTTGT